MGGSGLDEDQRRHDILEAAMTCFVREGYARTRVEDIARAAGLSRPLLYRHFKNKEAVFADLTQHIVRSALRRAEHTLNGDEDIWTRIAAAFETWTEDHFRLLDSPHGNELLETDVDTVRALVVEGHAALSERLTAALRAAEAAGTLDLSARVTPEALSDMLMTAHAGFKADRTPRETYRERLRTLVALLRRATTPELDATDPGVVR